MTTFKVGDTVKIIKADPRNPPEVRITVGMKGKIVEQYETTDPSYIVQLTNGEYWSYIASELEKVEEPV